MANKVCMSVEKVINWKWKWANHSYKIFLIKNNTKLYSKINERCGFFFFFDKLFFFVKRLWNHMKTKRLSRNGSFSSSIIFFLEVKMMSNCTNTKKISVANSRQNGIFFPFFLFFLFFQFYLSILHYQISNFGHEISCAS